MAVGTAAYLGYKGYQAYKAWEDDSILEKSWNKEQKTPPKQNQQPDTRGTPGGDWDPDDHEYKDYKQFKKQDGSGRYECEKQESPQWKELKNFKDEYRTNGLQGKHKEYYRWDKLHKDIEVYDSKGRALGSQDPITGKMYRQGDMLVNKKLEKII